MTNINNQSIRMIAAAIVLSLAPLTWAQITPSQDAYTNSASPTTNYGSAITLGTTSTATSIETTYILFDLSAVPSGYTGANVAKATLKLYVNAVPTGGNFNIDYVDGGWAEKTITANLAPALGTTIASSIPLNSANVHDFVQIDVTTAVQAWLNGTQANDGIALVANSPLSATFDSKENSAQSHPAELDIVFSGNGTITGVTTASGSGLTGGGTTGSLKLGLTTTCAANQVLQWNGSAWACAAVGTGTITGVTGMNGIAGGGSSGSVTLSLAANSCGAGNALVALPAACAPFATLGSNTLIGNQTVIGNVAATTLSGSGAGVTNVNAVSLAGLAPTAFAQLASSNVFATSQYINANLEVDSAGTNSGTITPGLQFGAGASGEGISSDRTNGLNNFQGIDFYTRSTPRLSITNSGWVGIGTIYPVAMLNVFSTDSVFDGIQSSGYTQNSGSGRSGTAGVAGFGGNGDPNGTTTHGGAGLLAQGGDSTSGDGGDGVDAYVGAGVNAGYAGYFSGNIDVTGAITASTKDFKIDHPLDPANKYLYHASVESSEMMNIYTGNVTTDAQGEATVQLPAWFEVLNADFRYQLTVIGVFAQAIVSREIGNHQFQIRTSLPNVKVSWQVTGVRQDPYAKAHPLVVEQQKEEPLRGFYIRPELYGAPEEKQIEWARHPDTMRRLKENRQKQSTAAARH